MQIIAYTQENNTKTILDVISNEILYKNLCDKIAEKYNDARYFENGEPNRFLMLDLKRSLHHKVLNFLNGTEKQLIDDIQDINNAYHFLEKVLSKNKNVKITTVFETTNAQIKIAKPNNIKTISVLLLSAVLFCSVSFLLGCVITQIKTNLKQPQITKVMQHDRQYTKAI
jgi:hypothetical protein